MPKSHIIIELIDDLVPLNKSLTRLLVLAKDVDNKALYSWASKELKGYDKDIDSLPDYRICQSVDFMYSGFNKNVQVTKVPLPKSWFPEEILSKISTAYLYEGIKTIEELKNSERPSVINYTELAGYISEQSDGLISCTSIYGNVPKSALEKIIDSVKERALLALIEMEKKYGVLDELFIDISNEKKSEIDYNNKELNRMVLNINVPNQMGKDSVPSKIAWNIIVPILTAVGSSIITYIVTQFLFKGNQ